MADCIERTFGPGRRDGVDGHPKLEPVELYRKVEERRYLDLAAHLIGQRGRGSAGNVYPEHRGGTAVFQDDASVRARCTGTLALRSGWEDKAL